MAAQRRDFSGKVVVITGAASGIGRATAMLFARLGAKVQVVDLDAAGAEEVRAQIVSRGGMAAASAVDVSDAAAVEELADQVFAEDGAVDVLHNNAGIAHGGPVEETELAVWRHVIDVNLMGTIYGIHYFVPRMLKQGRPAHIVNTASAAGLFAVPQLAPYCASKFAVVGLTESLNAELSPKGIHVSAVCPGIIHTGITASAAYRGEMANRADSINAFYAARGASPETVAEAVLDAVVKRKVIRTVPRSHVVPAWLLQRASPRAYQVGARQFRRLFEAMSG